MRFTSFAVLTVAFLASITQGKIGFGKCPADSDIPSLTFAEYDTAQGGIVNAVPTYHQFLFIDKQFMKMYKLLKPLIPGSVTLPDPNCGDIGTFPPFSEVAKAIKTANKVGADGKNFFYLDATLYNPIFSGPEDALLWRMVDFDKVIGAEYHYLCFDSFKTNGMIDQLKKMGLPLPTDILKTIVKVQNMINIFKLTLRLEIGYVLGNGAIA